MGMIGTNYFGYKKHFNKDLQYKRQELRRIDLMPDIRSDGTVIVDRCKVCSQLNQSDIEPVEDRFSCKYCDTHEGTGWRSSFIDFVIDKALTLDEKNYLYKAIDTSEYFGFMLDKLIFEASTFSGHGLVKGFAYDIGKDCLDEVPAELPDGVFVFTSKAVRQIGVKNLEKLLEEYNE